MSSKPPVLDGPPSAAPRPGTRFPLSAALIVVLAILPVVLLHPFAMALRREVGIRHPATLATLMIVYGLPAILIARWVPGTEADRRRRLGSVILALASIMVSLGILEVAVRVAGLDPSSRRAWRRYIGDRPYAMPSEERPTYGLKPRAKWGHQYSSNDRGYFGADNAVHYRINGKGYRGGEFSEHKDPGTRRIALLGDSFGFGEGVEEEDTVAARLETLLGQQTGCVVETYNFSVPGYASVNEAAILEHEVLGYHPDLVVIWFFLNDAQTNETMRYLGGNDEAVFFRLERRFSALARFVGLRLDMLVLSRHMILSYKSAFEPDDPRWQLMVSSLGRMQALSRDAGVPIVLFVHPILYRLGKDYPFTNLHRKVLDVTRSIGMTSHDLYGAFADRTGETLWVHASDQHPNEIGHGIAAEYAARHLAPLLENCKSTGP